MAGRTWEKTADGRFTPAGVARSQRSKETRFYALGDKRALGTTPKHPTGKFSNSQAQKMIKNGDKVKMNVKGKEVTVQVTKANRDEVIKSLTANVAPNPIMVMAKNTNRPAGSKENKGTIKVYRGTADNPKITSRGAERGKRNIRK